MLELAPSNNQPAHESIGNGQPKRYTQAHTHQPLITSSPDSAEQESERDVSDAPDPHECMVQRLELTLVVYGKLQALEMSVGAERGIRAECNKHQA